MNRLETIAKRHTPLPPTIDGELQRELIEARQDCNLLYPRPNERVVYRRILGNLIDRLPGRSRWRERNALGVLDTRFFLLEHEYDGSCRSSLYLDQTPRDFYTYIGEAAIAAGVSKRLVTRPLDVVRADARIMEKYAAELYDAYVSLRKEGYRRHELTS
jgi:hypothetical protein